MILFNYYLSKYVQLKKKGTNVKKGQESRMYYFFLNITTITVTELKTKYFDESQYRNIVITL